MSNSTTDDATQGGSKGYGAYISAIMSAVALIAAAHPSWRWFVFVRDHASDVVNVAPYILGPLGVVGGMLSHPPASLRARWERVKAGLTLAWQVIRGKAA